MSHIAERATQGVTSRAFRWDKFLRLRIFDSYMSLRKKKENDKFFLSANIGEICIR